MISSASLINPYAADTTTGGTTSTSSNGSTSGPDNELTGNSFLTLLTAQLQAQDPLDPVDPSTFMTELVQFNQLEQLININQTLSSLTSPGSTSSGSDSNGTGANAASSNATPAGVSSNEPQASSNGSSMQSSPINDLAPLIHAPSSKTATF